MNSSENIKKRKRTKNTSVEQYELYIQALQGDYPFRSNIINPTLPSDYLQHKWEQLCEQLNGVGDGPALSVEEWKKRFCDWKYATKAKYRKIKNHYMKTGGGPNKELKLTPLEEKALDLWGRVTVTEATEVTTYEGVPTTLEMNDTHDTISVDDPIHIEDTINTEENIIITFENAIDNEPLLTKSNIEQKNSIPLKTRKRIRSKPLSLLAEYMIEMTNNNLTSQNNLNELLKHFCENYIRLQKGNINLKKTKLDFEIKKFKYQNPDFDFY